MGEVFDRMFPYYLSIGMTYELYWQGPAELVRAYREAEKMRNDTRNAEMWLQGMYIYEALCDAAPIFRDFVKKGTKPRPYPSRQYDLHPKKKRTDARTEEKKKMERGIRFMQQQVARASAKKQEVKKE